MTTVIVVAPHPDDETLGCGGTLLRHRVEGDAVHWLIVTAMTEAAGWNNAVIAARENEIAAIGDHFGFHGTHRLDFPAAGLDVVPRADLVCAINDVFKVTAPDTVYVPFAGDAHSDHRIVAETAGACTKWFRQPGVKRVLAYETLSETEFGLLAAEPFAPNHFVDISATLEGKIAAMKLYKSEIDGFPFPRSEEAMRAQAAIRGSTIGVSAAEAFMLLREIV